MTLGTTGGGTPARRKMIEVMDMKGLSPETKDSYLRSVIALAKSYDRPPQTLSAEEVGAWVLGRIDAGLFPRTTNADVTALRLFYRDAMDQPEKVKALYCRRVADRVPRSIAEADVGFLIEGIDDPRYRTATLVAYGCALRVSEVAALKVSDIRSAEGLLRIACGKGGHERMAHLPETVLWALRRYWKSTVPHPSSWLFYGASPERPITTDSLRAAFNKSRDRAGLDRGITFHCLRHSIATHLYERGARISVVQDYLGHKSLETTRVYARATGAMYRTLDHPVNEVARDL